MEYLSGNVLPGNLVVVTLRELSTKFNVSITWVARIFDRLQIDGFVAKKSQGIWTVSDEFLKLTKKPTNRTQFVIDIEEVPEQIEMFEKDGSINIDNIK
ncbi:replication/maintenance protein RepL [Streptococcus suis]|uniref:replication/maintenance protein RepL n=1 Tax=Streptococcus suis TaxID=1307 RepID=UPI000CF5CD4D|nr:replication/maintenance protein RepL [Streptococcus suis]